MLMGIACIVCEFYLKEALIELKVGESEDICLGSQPLGGTPGPNSRAGDHMVSAKWVWHKMQSVAL